MKKLYSYVLVGLFVLAGMSAGNFLGAMQEIGQATGTDGKEASKVLPVVQAVQEEVKKEVKEQTLLQKIADINVATLPREEEASLGDVLDDPYAQFNFFTKTISNPQLYNQRKRAFAILANAEISEKNSQELANQAITGQATKIIDDSIIDEQTLGDLNLLAGSKKNPTEYLGSILAKKRTHTQLGHAYLYGLLARPTDDVKLLESRQAMVKELVNNKELLQRLDTIYKETAQRELFFTGLWDTELMMQCISQDYYQISYVDKYLNESSAALELKALWNQGDSFLGQALSLRSILAFTTFGLLTYSYFFSAPQWLSDHVGKTLPVAGPLFEAISWINDKGVNASAALVAGTLSVLSLKKNLQFLHTGFLYTDFLRKRLIHISAYIDCMRTILTTVAQVPALKNNLVFLKRIDQLLNELPKTNSDMAHLLSKLQAKTFAKDSLKGTSIVFNYGNVLSAYRLLGKVKQQFETAMAGLGEIDAYMTIAKLIRDSEQKSAKFCFPTYFAKKQTPTIVLQDVWSPFIDPQVVVTNSINLGVEYKQPNLVVTGPNSAGKSTILKSVILALIMGQSLGIAPVQAMSFTPFGNIVTYSNVSDSQVDQESRFQAEARRVFEYGDKVDEISKKSIFSFAIFDEIFSGTSPEEGADLGLKVARALTLYPTCMSIVSTHFPKITALETNAHGNYVNYKVSVEQDSHGKIVFENGKIKRLFKIVPGISDQHIAIDVFNEKGINSPFFQKNIGN